MDDAAESNFKSLCYVGACKGGSTAFTEISSTRKARSKRRTSSPQPLHSTSPAKLTATMSSRIKHQSQSIIYGLSLASIAYGTYILVNPFSLASTWGVPELADRPTFRAIGVRNVVFGVWMWKMCAARKETEITSMLFCIPFTRIIDWWVMSGYAAELGRRLVLTSGPVIFG
ncbi:hypothetical protein BU16DRAFT_221226 [Lophium mytilinum]|uniref:Uncharacterized protein n=1 Tax=Lophium mytilinum TaxID=390894 RepID=A0A6A6QAE7_9PEZI|nr:hypothetical protein BU16DRAFT_221226 [Lophium mytilinum]